jgi:hypothetical protein
MRVEDGHSYGTPGCLYAVIRLYSIDALSTPHVPALLDIGRLEGGEIISAKWHLIDFIKTIKFHFCGISCSKPRLTARPSQGGVA